MFCSRYANSKINKLHKRLYDYNSKPEHLLTEDSSFPIHGQNIQEIEMFKIHRGFSQASFLDFSHSYNENNFYSLRSEPDFYILRINPTLKGTESVRYFVPVIWKNIPTERRSINNFDTFKTEIRKRKTKNC